MAPEEAWRHHGCGDLSGVNGTPLLRGIEFTHAPAQARKAWLECGAKARRVTQRTQRGSTEGTENSGVIGGAVVLSIAAW
jgi:hypothetical protein